MMIISFIVTCIIALIAIFKTIKNDVKTLQYVFGIILLILNLIIDASMISTGTYSNNFAYCLGSQFLAIIGIILIFTSTKD